MPLTGSLKAGPVTLPKHKRKSLAELLTCVSEAEAEAFLSGLSANALKSLPWMFEFWALAHQIAPQGEWSTWVILGGRGAGKTRAGAEWVRGQVEGSRSMDGGKCRQIALVGETYDQVRDVMVFGDSGILACCPPDRRPRWEASRRRLVWPNGAVATCYSASDPEALRGPQFDGAWVDELAKWKKGRAAWDMLQFALRLGDDPQQVVTTTPRNVAILHDILAGTDVVMTTAPTSANAVNLAQSFLDKVTADYGGTRQGREELDGELLKDVDGALWHLSDLDAGHIDMAPTLDRVVVAVDPPTTSGENADACGIIVAGVVMQGPPQNWRAYILADLTMCSVTPNAWAAAVTVAVKEFGADRVVAEVNQGGEMVEAVLRQHSALLPYKGVRASRGKSARAEPVAAL
ncbi:MAG: DNA-packaging protein, partial [Proteobacteria bacterium]|nr:DNA-packaging protein [Pseudomonadota bacterium]